MIDGFMSENADASVVLTWNEQEGWERGSIRLAEEVGITLYLERVELATFMCTTEKLNFLIAGFLRSEGFIEQLSDLALLRVCSEERVAEARLMKPRPHPEKRILTSGCGGGVTFDAGDDLPRVESNLRISPENLLARMKEMQQAYGSKGDRGGMHLSALSDGDSLLAVARDVGRHNTLDKIWGECLFREIDTRDKILLTTGRLSSEMMTKAAKMGVPITVSLNSPTTRSAEIAEKLGITVVGYARGSRVSVYTHPERLGAMAPANGKHTG